MPATTPPDATLASPALTQQIGHYEILAKIGEGGMGVVYRARDTRLNREVAIKVLPRGFAEDPLRMARFEREAQLLASLNHPKIAAIYGLEESGATRALVMELVEGPTLAERIGRTPVSARPKVASAPPAQASGGAASGAKTSAGSGAKTGERGASARSGSAGGARKAAIPVDEALPIAQQVAEALEYAHEHGVIHRDLKPANIKMTPDGDVKVLDFGLAKAMGPESASGDMSNSPTLSLAMTEAGLIIGTAAYMSPEQAKAKPVDRRADIWSFGCVLYEMLAGQKAFEGETVSDVLAAVIMKEPDWTALPEATPTAIQRLVRRCLQKDPRQRLQAIGDARIAIEEVSSGAYLSAETAAIDIGAPEGKHLSRLSRVLPWTLAALLMLAFIGVLAAWRLLAPAPQPTFRFTVSPPENTEFAFNGASSISPDGRTLAFVAPTGPGKPPVIWLRPLDSVSAQPIAGTEGALQSFWSPDGREIGFFAMDFKLKKIAVSGGTPQAICDFDIMAGATWNRDGVILLAKTGGIYSVPDTGGTPTLVLAPGTAGQEGAYLFPQFLPDGRHFLFQVARTSSSAPYIAAGSLGSKTVKHLLDTTTNATYAPPGNLFYLDQGTLVTRPFEAEKLRFTGPAVSVAQNVGSINSVLGLFSVSQTGVLTYVAEPTTIQNTAGQMTWFNRSGEKVGTVGEPGIYSTPALSPDGTRLAVSVGEYGKQDIWIYDLKRGTASRLTFNPAYNTNPSWSPDGSEILFSSAPRGPWGIYEIKADGLGSTQPVSLAGNQAKALNDLSQDGRYAIYDTGGSVKSNQLWALSLSGDRKPFPFVQGSFGAWSAQFSPNARYVAYSSFETGRPEVYVQTFPKHIGKWQISTSGGIQPMWRRDGKELFFLMRGENFSDSSDTKLMSVAVDSGSAAFQDGIPKELFRTQLIPLWLWRNVYVPSPDGQRFLMIVPVAPAKPQPITVVVNWPALLKK